MSSFISGSNIAYEFSNGTTLFENLHFSFGPRTYGLIGSNGCGKTTLLKLLCGELIPTAGALSLSGTVAVLPQIHDSLNQSEQITIDEVLGIQNITKALREVKASQITSEVMETIGENWDIE